MDMLNMMIDGSMCPGCGGFPAVDGTGGPMLCDDCMESDMINKIDWPLNEWLPCRDNKHEAILYTLDGQGESPLIGEFREKDDGHPLVETWDYHGKAYPPLKHQLDIIPPKKKWDFPSSMYVAVNSRGGWARTESEALVKQHAENGGDYREYVPKVDVSRKDIEEQLSALAYRSKYTAQAGGNVVDCEDILQNIMNLIKGRGDE